MKRATLILAFLFFSTVGAFAQLENPVTWAYTAKKLNNNEAIVYIKATIDESWHIYSQDLKPGGPNKTIFSFSPSKEYTLVGKTIEPKPKSKYEKVFKMDVQYFEKEVIFQQKVKLNKGATAVKGKVEYMVCNETTCLPPTDVEFSIPVK